MAVTYRVSLCHAVDRFPLLCTLPKLPSVFLPLEQMAVLKPFCSPFTGEYYELEQRWFPWQRTAQSTKCSQYSRNVLDEATHAIGEHLSVSSCFRGPEKEQCAECICFVHKGVIHVTAGSLFLFRFVALIHEYLNRNMNIQGF